MRIGIKIKLAVILASLLFVATFTMGAVMVAHQRSSLEAQMRSMAATITDEFASDSKIPLMQKDSLAMNLLVQSMLKYPGITDAYILNDNYLIEGHTDIHKVGQPYDDIKPILKAKGTPPWLVSTEVGQIVFASPIFFKGTTVGYTVISFSNEFIKERVHLAITSLIAIAVVATALVTLVSIPLSSGLLRPVFRLFKGTKEIALGNFDYQIPVKSKDEMGDLIRSFNKMAAELKKKEVLKGVFNRYVSQHVADEILKEPEMIRLGGDRRDVTVFFADVRGFTSLSRKMPPEDTVEYLNSYFTLITEIIFRFEGTVDKFIGDAVMTVFGSPIQSDRHLEQGIKAAVAIKKAVEKVNSLRQGCALVPFKIGIGLDSGEVIIGNMGSQVRMEYTAVGEAVNMAARLTDHARGGDIIVSGLVYDKIKNHVVAESMPGVSIKGFESPLTLYAVSDLKGQWKQEVDEIIHRTVIEV